MISWMELETGSYDNDTKHISHESSIHVLLHVSPGSGATNLLDLIAKASPVSPLQLAGDRARSWLY